MDEGQKGQRGRRYMGSVEISKRLVPTVVEDVV